MESNTPLSQTPRPASLPAAAFSDTAPPVEEVRAAQLGRVTPKPNVWWSSDEKRMAAEEKRVEREIAAHERMIVSFSAAGYGGAPSEPQQPEPPVDAEEQARRDEKARRDEQARLDKERREQQKERDRSR